MMARRPDPVEFDQPLSVDEVKALARRLGMLSTPGVMDAYRRAHLACSITGENVPRAADIQELVVAWKIMRAWALRRSQDRH